LGIVGSVFVLEVELDAVAPLVLDLAPVVAARCALPHAATATATAIAATQRAARPWIHLPTR
jgi:hypothetical protein